MTYKESYMNCATLAELEKEILTDIVIATRINPDRLKAIKVAGEEVAKLKFENEIPYIKTT